MADMQHIKCKTVNGKRRQIAKTSHFVKKSGAVNRMTRSEILLQVYNSRFCACAIKMLLKMAANATKRSTFEVQYVKSTSLRTTAVRY